MSVRKKWFVLVALVLCVSLLAGCGGSGTNTAVPQVKAEVPAASPSETAAGSSDDAVTEERDGYRTQYLELDDSTLTSELSNGTVVGDAVYYTALGVLDDRTPEGVTPEWPEQYWVYGPVLCKVTLDGSVERVPYAPPAEDTEETGNSGTLFEALGAAPDGNLWLVENHYHNWTDASGDAQEPEDAGAYHNEENFRLVCVREDGTLVSQFPLDELNDHAEEVKDAEGYYEFEVVGIAFDKEGHICLAVHEWFSGSSAYVQENKICLMDPQSGKLLESVPMRSTVEHMVGLPGGEIAICTFEGGKEHIGLLDFETGSMSSSVVINDFVNGMAAGFGDYAVCFSAGDSLYGVDLEKGSTERLLNWIDCDVARRGEESICVLADGRIVTTASREKKDHTENDLILLEHVEAGQLPQRKVLRLAVMNLYPFTSEMVTRFNRSNTEYRIEVTDYSQFNDYSTGNEEDWNAGINRLQTEIIAGDVPDILDISLLSAERLGSRGILEDLYTYMDADPELSRSDLMEHVLEAFEEDGKLYQTVGNFYVLTTAGLSTVVGDKIGWNMEQFNAAMKMLQAENPDSTVFDLYTTRDTAMTFLLYLDMENFVDWNTGECRFESDEFIHFLEFVKNFPVAFDWSGGASAEQFDEDSRLRMGAQLMKQCNFATFEDYQVNTIGLKGAPCTFVGYPTENGAGSMFAQIGNQLAITSGCPDKDAAWQFVRQFFLPDYQEQFAGAVFPTNLTVYEEMKHEAMTPQFQRNPDGSFMLNTDGERIEEDRGSVKVNGEEYQYKTVTADEVARVEEIIAATNNILHVDESLKAIIVEGAAPYLSDQRSVEEVARLIQSKAMLYVNEQR